MAKKALKILEYIALLGIAGLLIWLALRGIDWKVFVENLHTVKWWGVGLSALACVMAIAIRAERWKDMLLPLDPSTKRITVWDASNVGSLSYLAIPGSGEFVRCAGVTTKLATYDKVFGTTIMERTWDVVMVIVVTVLAVIFKNDEIGSFMRESVLKPAAGRMTTQLWVILGAAVVAIGVFIYLIFKLRDRSKFFGKLAGWIIGIVDGFKTFGAIKHKWRFMIYTVGIWFFYVAMCQCVFWAMPELGGLTFADALFISAIGNVASLIPVPGGMGAYHYIIALAMSQIYGFGWETGILFATLTHESRSLMLVVLGAVSSVNMSLTRKRAASAAN